MSQFTNNHNFRDLFQWDATGNLIYHRFDGIPGERFLCWNEANRLQGVRDDEYLSFYQYDANGERTYKLTSSNRTQLINGHWSTYTIMDNATLYASPYLVATPKGYTKHYYAENERIASKIGMGGLKDICKSLCPDMTLQYRDPESECEEPRECFYEKLGQNQEHSELVMGECLGTSPEVEPNLLTEGLYSMREVIEENEQDCYWYHPDHLGSSSWITNINGSAVQHLHYLPWGEDFVDQRSTNWNAMYTFSAKEKDTETGYSYFGARYYSSDLSIWLSVDPMSDKYPSLSPYVYCANNPIKLVDPNGEAWYIDGHKYSPGQNCPDGVLKSTQDKWNTMNEIYKTKNGKTVIEALNGDDCKYYVSSDIKSNSKGGFSAKDKTIYLNGNDRNVGTLAHEMFHAYQDYNNRSEASIFNEVEANLFSFSVLFQQCKDAGDCIMPPENSSLLNGKASNESSKEYQQYYGNVIFLLLGNFDRDIFNNVVSGFLQYSKDNAGEKYSKGYKKGCDIYEKTLIEEIFK